MYWQAEGASPERLPLDGACTGGRLSPGNQRFSAHFSWTM